MDDAVRSDEVNGVVAGIGDIEIAHRVDRHAGRRLKRRLRGRAADGGETRLAVARDGPDVAVEGDFADAVIAGVRDEEVAGGIERQSLWSVELGRKSLLGSGRRSG